VLNLCKELEGDGRKDAQAKVGTDLRAAREQRSVHHEDHEGGYKVTYLPVDRDGLLNLADSRNAITDDAAVVSMMWANNETGVLFPVKEIGEICRARGVLFHCDGVQAGGKIEIDVRKVPADYLSLTGHKFHAPKGVGALYVRRKAPFSTLKYGGHGVCRSIFQAPEPASHRCPRCQAMCVCSGFLRCSTGTDRTASKTSDATMVLSLPPP
jgi:hypothetical protein